MRRILPTMAVAFLLCSCGPSPSQDSSGPPSNLRPITNGAATTEVRPVSSDYTISGPYVYENLTLFLIHKPGVAKDAVTYLTLEEALEAKALLITEKSDGAEVNQIQVENTGDQPVYLQAGDTVKGGKQDRTIAVDLVLPPKSGKREIDAFCVEPGRWSARSREMEGGQRYANVFGAAAAPVATKEQKLAVKLARNQSQVWEEGRKANEDLAMKSAPASSAGKPLANDSYVLTIEAPVIQQNASKYTEALGKVCDGKEDAVGCSFAVNGEPSTVELYSGPGLFKKLWPKLLKGAALEALSKKSDQRPSREVAEADIQKLMSQASDGKASTRRVSDDVTMETVNGDRSALFDTKIKGTLLHRQVVSK